jgi:hypothetical protein
VNLEAGGFANVELSLVHHGKRIQLLSGFMQFEFFVPESEQLRSVAWSTWSSSFKDMKDHLDWQKSHISRPCPVFL